MKLRELGVGVGVVLAMAGAWAWAATPAVCPRGNGEGSLGVNTVRWGNVYGTTGEFGRLTVGGTNVLLEGGGGADAASTNYFRNAVNLTNLAAAGIVTNGGVTINGSALGNGTNLTITAGIDGGTATNIARDVVGTSTVSYATSAGTAEEADHAAGADSATVAGAAATLQPLASGEDLTLSSNLVVNGAQTNTGPLTVLGGGNVVTNGQTGVTLDFTSATGPDATTSNQFATKAQLDAMAVGNIAYYFASNLTAALTNSVTPTNQTYFAASSVSGIQGPATITIPSLTNGAYLFAQGCTNRGFTRMADQVVNGVLYISENEAGTVIGKVEVYLRDRASGVESEYGEGGDTFTVADNATPQRTPFAVPVVGLTTNLFDVWAKFKRTGGTASGKNIILGVGTGYVSHVEFSVPSSELLEGYVKNGDSGVTLSGTLTPTNALTVTNALQLGGVAAAQYPTNLNTTGAMDPWHPATVVNTYTLSTITVSRAMGQYIPITLTNNATICIDQNTYPTNGSVEFRIDLYVGAFSATWCTNSISTNTSSGYPRGSSSIVLTNNAYNSILFERPWGASNVLFGCQQIR